MLAKKCFFSTNLLAPETSPQFLEDRKTLQRSTKRFKIDFRPVYGKSLHEILHHVALSVVQAVDAQLVKNSLLERLQCLCGQSWLTWWFNPKSILFGCVSWSRTTISAPKIAPASPERSWWLELEVSFSLLECVKAVNSSDSFCCQFSDKIQVDKHFWTAATNLSFKILNWDCSRTIFVRRRNLYGNGNKVRVTKNLNLSFVTQKEPKSLRTTLWGQERPRS